MPWPPAFTLDLIEHGLLPDGWRAELEAAAQAPERMLLETHPGDGADADPWTFAVVEGDVLRARLPWVWSLYRGALRAFSARSVGYPLFVSNRLRAGVTLNILSGTGAATGWHRDMNVVTGVLYAAMPDQGGNLLFRRADGETAVLTPRPGLFVCFEGATEHHVTPLSPGGQRLALPMIYYGSATDQPPAYGADIYTAEDDTGVPRASQ